MTQSNLNVQRPRNHVTHHDEKPSIACRGDGLADDEVAKPEPEKDVTGYFEPSMPPCWTLLGAKTEY